MTGTGSFELDNQVPKPKLKSTFSLRSFTSLGILGVVTLGALCAEGPSLAFL